ncbi:16296_t:CDS:2, partial [Acaulospora morrowiae]
AVANEGELLIVRCVYRNRRDVSVRVILASLVVGDFIPYTIKNRMDVKQKNQDKCTLTVDHNSKPPTFPPSPEMQDSTSSIAIFTNHW